MADKTTDEIFKDKLTDSARLDANEFSSVFVSNLLGAKTAVALPYLYQQAPIRSILPLACNGREVLLNGNFWGVVPYEGKYDALGLVSLSYDGKTRKLSAPKYWINPLFNFQEIAAIQPVRTSAGQSFVATTYEGRLILITR